jgi:L-lactate utilization protein LutB
MENSRTPLTSSEEAALDHLEQYLNVANDEVPTREGAVVYLMEQGVERADARAYIEQLLLKGYLYEVEDELRLPSRL